MSKIDVDLILRYEGVEHLRAGRLVTYAWRENAVQITVTFDNDKLVSKAQFGLR